MKKEKSTVLIAEEKQPSKSRTGIKNYATVMTAVLAFACAFAALVDMAFSKNDGWFLYVIGAAVMIWSFAVMIPLKAKGKVYTATVCALSVANFVLMIFSLRLAIMLVALLVFRFVFIEMLLKLKKDNKKQ